MELLLICVSAVAVIALLVCLIWALSLYKQLKTCAARKEVLYKDILKLEKQVEDHKESFKRAVKTVREHFESAVVAYARIQVVLLEERLGREHGSIAWVSKDTLEDSSTYIHARFTEEVARRYGVLNFFTVAVEESGECFVEDHLFHNEWPCSIFDSLAETFSVIEKWFKGIDDSAIIQGD